MGHDDNLIIIALLLFIIALFGLVGSYISRTLALTGFASEEQVYINVTIEKRVAFDFIVGNINWGPGYVDTLNPPARINTLGTNLNGTWQNVTEGFIIRNVGNVNISMNISSGQDADGFIGGTNPSYKYNISNIDPGVCNPPGAFNLNEFYDASTTSQRICDSLEVGGDIGVDLELIIPLDSKSGNLTDSFSITVQEA